VTAQVFSSEQGFDQPGQIPAPIEDCRNDNSFADFVVAIEDEMVSNHQYAIALVVLAP
jgi:hypothetical protein